MTAQTSEQETLSDVSTRVLAGAGVQEAGGWRAVVRTIVVLFKLRVVSLLLLAAVAGTFLGAEGWPGWGTLLLILVTGGMAASGASALNQYIERYSDGAMSRTRSRPLAAGAIPRPQLVVPVAIALILVPSLAVLPSNPALAFFLVLGALIYVGIYTLWLKPRTLLNIVIGGAAGSAAVMSGGAAANGWQDPAVIGLALLIFLWTPSHFWSLAILYRNDYQQVDVPMLPARTSVRAAAWWVMVHSLATALATLALAVDDSLGWVYLVPAGLAVADLLRRNISLIRRPDRPTARAFFISSNIYLMVVLLALCVATVLPW